MGTGYPKVPRELQRPITDEIRREILKMGSEGGSYREIAWKLKISRRPVETMLKPLGGVIRHEMWWNPSKHRLSMEERVEIHLGLQLGQSFRAIARRINRAPSTVSREVKSNGGIANYRPVRAHGRAGHMARRPKPTKLATNPFLCERVITDLEKRWSPEQISKRLRNEFGEDRNMQISPETIYKSLYVQGKGELRRELAACLRSGRARRVARHLNTRKNPKISDMVLISERPPEVEDRAVPGHWEGDLLMGKDNKSAIGTLVERSTRYVLLFSLKSKTAEEVREQMTKTIRTLPESLRRTLTWDQGREMAEHLRFEVDTGVQVYFCDPHSPWQRGTNENTNGLLRQYFPKGHDLRKYSEQELRAVADSLNDRPRKTLNWLKPAEKLAEFVASIG